MSSVLVMFLVTIIDLDTQKNHLSTTASSPGTLLALSSPLREVYTTHQLKNDKDKADFPLPHQHCVYWSPFTRSRLTFPCRIIVSASLALFSPPIQILKCLSISLGKKLSSVRRSIQSLLSFTPPHQNYFLIRYSDCKCKTN